MNTLFYLEVTRAIFKSHGNYPAHIQQRKGASVIEPQKRLKVKEKIENLDFYMASLISVPVTQIYFSGPSLFGQFTWAPTKWLSWDLGSPLYRSGLEQAFPTGSISWNLNPRGQSCRREKLRFRYQKGNIITRYQRARKVKPGQELRIKIFKTVRHRGGSEVGYWDKEEGKGRVLGSCL